MKDEDIVLTGSIIFIVLVVIGLILQSCRTPSTTRERLDVGVQQTATATLDSTYSDDARRASSAIRDSLQSHRFFYGEENGWTVSREYYLPVSDTLGHVIGSYLASREQIKRTERNKTEVEQQAQVSNVKADSAHSVRSGQVGSTYKDSTAIRDRSDIRQKPPVLSIATYIRRFVFLLFVIGFGFFLFKNFRR